MAVAAAGDRAAKDAVIGSELPDCTTLVFSTPKRDCFRRGGRKIFVYELFFRAQARYIENSRSDARMPMQTPQNIQR
jgi:hypothetical protein